MLIRILAATYLATMMFAFGLDLGGETGRQEKDIKKKKRRVLASALLFNLVVLPAVAAVIVRALGTHNELSAALLLLAAAPGGRFAPQLVKLGGGAVPLSVELTLFLAKLTAFTAPVTARWLLELHSLTIRDLPFLVQLVALQLIPYFLGRWLRRRREAVALPLLRWAQAAALAAGVTAFVAVFLKARNPMALALDVHGWAAVAAVAVASSGLGWIAGGSDRATGRALSIHANARELSLALAMASVVYPDGYAHAALFAVWFALSIVSLALAGALHAWRSRPRTRLVEREAS
jgi:BASS family bile acid:Na+ symporter